MSKPTPGRERCVSRSGRLLSSFQRCGACGSFILCEGELSTARELGEQLLSLAQGAQDSSASVRIPLSAGGNLGLAGRVTCCPRALGAGTGLLRPAPAPLLTFLSGWHDPGVSLPLSCGLGLVASRLPGPSSAEDRRGAYLGQELSHSSTLAITLIFTAFTSSVLSGGATSSSAGGSCDYPCDRARVSSPRWHWERSCEAGCWPMHGQGEEGIAQIRQGLAALRATGAEQGRIGLAMLAETYGKIGADRGRVKGAG